MATAYIPLNHCAPQIQSKRYIESDFSSKYPRSVKFECNYDCHVNGKIEVVPSIRDVRVHNMDEDAKLTGCQGVQVKKVAWGYDFDKIVPFYAYATDMKEMKRFAFEFIDPKNSTEVEFLKHLKENLQTVSSAYRVTGVPNFINAAFVLEKITAELPDTTKTLDKYISEIVQLKGKIPPVFETHGLILTNINAHAAWRIPSHLFVR